MIHARSEIESIQLIQRDRLLGGNRRVVLVDVRERAAVAERELIRGEAEGAAKSDKTAVTPVVAISVASNTTNANADAATSALNAGSLNVTASHEGSNNVSATGNTESGKTGIFCAICHSYTATRDTPFHNYARGGQEYVEAVVMDALHILPSYQDRSDTLVVINARRVAVILDKQAQRGAVIPVSFIEQVIEGPMKERLQAYLASPTQAFYVMHIAGSWFTPASGPQSK